MLRGQQAACAPLRQFDDQRFGRQAEQGGDAVRALRNLVSSAGIWAMVEFTQTFGLHDVETRGGTGFELELGQLSVSRRGLRFSRAIAMRSW